MNLIWKRLQPCNTGNNHHERVGQRQEREQKNLMQRIQSVKARSDQLTKGKGGSGGWKEVPSYATVLWFGAKVKKLPCIKYFSAQTICVLYLPHLIKPRPSYVHTNTKYPTAYIPALMDTLLAWRSSACRTTGVRFGKSLHVVTVAWGATFASRARFGRRKLGVHS